MNFKPFHKFFFQILTCKFTLGSGETVFLYSSDLSVMHLAYQRATDDCYGQGIGLMVKRKKKLALPGV